MIIKCYQLNRNSTRKFGIIIIDIIPPNLRKKKEIQSLWLNHSYLDNIVPPLGDTQISVGESSSVSQSPLSIFWPASKQQSQFIYFLTSGYVR